VLLATRHSARAAKVSATNQLKALIVGAPEALRAELRGLATKQQVRRCAVLRHRPARLLGHRMTVRALRCTARRIQVLAAEAAELRAELERPVAAIAPWLLELPGVGPISAAQVLVSWSHAGRLRSEATLPPWPAQPDPGVLRAGHQASAEPRRRPAAQPGAAHGRGGAAPQRPRHPRLRRPAPVGGQEHPRDPPVLEAGGGSAAVQAARTLRSLGS
jgi:hypothetical protein